MKFGRFVAAVMFALASATPALAQRQGPSVPVNALMTEAEFDATGLQALSQSQLDALSDWLAGYRRSIEWITLNAEGGEDLRGSAEEVIDTTIAGDFDGWVGDTVFRLENGQVWQQIEPSARYLFVRAPRVKISSAPHRLRVEGLEVEIAVRRLR